MGSDTGISAFVAQVTNQQEIDPKLKKYVTVTQVYQEASVNPAITNAGLYIWVGRSVAKLETSTLLIQWEKMCHP